MFRLTRPDDWRRLRRRGQWLALVPIRRVYMRGNAMRMLAERWRQQDFEELLAT